MSYVPVVLLLAVGVFAMAQQAYYSRKIELITLIQEDEKNNARSQGRGEGWNMALNDPHAIVKRYHQMFTYTMN